MIDMPLLISTEDAVATLTLNRPQVGNTIDLPLARALLLAAEACGSDPAIRCVVLTGDGKLFCGGGDLAEFAAAGERVPAFLRELADTLHLAVSHLMRMAKPLVVLAKRACGRRRPQSSHCRRCGLGSAFGAFHSGVQQRESQSGRRYVVALTALDRDSPCPGDDYWQSPYSRRRSRKDWPHYQNG